MVEDAETASNEPREANDIFKEITKRRKGSRKMSMKAEDMSKVCRCRL